MKYPLSMRVIHWTMAVIIMGMILAGWTMVRMDDATPAKFDHFYPWHKSFGILVLMLAITRFAVRSTSIVPALPDGLAGWERRASKIAHVLLYVLMVIVPVMGYSMSSSYTQSDGVFFFGTMLPELLPKNDARYEVFQLLHRVLAYTLLALITIHVIGALKHRFLDRHRDTDVLQRML
jgi:cytochrome b561